MKYLTLLLILFCLSAVNLQPIYAQGKIKELEKEIEKEKEEEESSERNETEDEDCDCHDDGVHVTVDGITGFIDFVSFTTQLSIGIFYKFPGENKAIYGESWGTNNFNEYPFFDNNDGAYAANSAKKFSVTANANRFYNSETLGGLGFRAKLSPNPFFSAEIQFSDLEEERPGSNDHIQFYNLFVNYNRLRARRMTFWWGIGMKGTNGSTSYNGIAFNMGSEIFIAKPISIHANFNTGYLNQNWVKETNLRVNVHLQRFYGFAGYQRFNVGNASINGVTYGLGIYL